MDRPYWFLMVRSDGQWHGPEFGDYDKRAVQEEQRDWKDSGTPFRDLAICKSESDDQASIDAKVAEFKAKQAL